MGGPDVVYRPARDQDDIEMRTRRYEAIALRIHNYETIRADEEALRRMNNVVMIRFDIEIIWRSQSVTGLYPRGT